MVFYLFSRPDLLETIRAEVSRTMTVERQGGGSSTHHLNVLKLRKDCPTLQTAFQEVLRLKAAQPLARRVMRDTRLGGFTLMKENILLIPTAAFHHDPKLWGADASVFRPERWLEGGGIARPTAAMLPFGGGQSLCPGRHFAAIEILAVSALLVMRFDIAPVDGKWKAPTTRKSSMTTGVLKPDWDIKIEVVERDEFRGDKWFFVLQAFQHG